MVQRFKRSFYASREQLVYAVVLEMGVKIGFAVLAATFLVYVSGILPAHIPLEELPNYWNLPLNEYLQATNLNPGWDWLRLGGEGDYINLFGICFLAGITIVCYLRIIVYPIRKKDRIFAGMLIVQAFILVLSASGILAAGH